MARGRSHCVLREHWMVLIRIFSFITARALLSSLEHALVVVFAADLLNANLLGSPLHGHHLHSCGVIV